MALRDGHQFTIEIMPSPISIDYVSVFLKDEDTGEERRSQQDRQWAIDFVEYAAKGGNDFYLFLLKTWNGGKEALH